MSSDPLLVIPSFTRIPSSTGDAQGLPTRIPSPLSSSPEAITARKSYWISSLRQQCFSDSLKWRNQCASLLRRVRRIRESMPTVAGPPWISPENRMQAMIEEYSIQTGLDYEQSKIVVDSTTPRGERGGTTDTDGSSSPIRRFIESATPALLQTTAYTIEAVVDNSSTDPAFKVDGEMCEKSAKATWLVYVYSRSVWLVLLSYFACFLSDQSWFPSLGILAIIIIGLPRFPYPRHSLWFGLLSYQLLVCGLKTLWQLPTVCDAGPKSWTIFTITQDRCPPVYVDTLATRIGLRKSPNWPFSNWYDSVTFFSSDLLIIIALILHIRSLYLSGRLSLSPRGARTLIWAVDEENVSVPVGRPTWDFYTYRFVLSLIILVLMIADWGTIASVSNSLGDSVARNHFSAWQVVAITAFIFQIIFDRCLYTVMSYYPPASGIGIGTSSLFAQSRNERSPGRRVILLSVSIQSLILLFTMNSRIVLRFFIPYFAYLVLSSRQLAYDIRSLGSQSGLMWAPGSASYWLYRMYLAVPFLDELKQIADWVATPTTALSLFMWFKVEDCLQNLRFIQAEMDSRTASLPMTRPDRQCVGIAALVGLVAILTGPLIFFSGLNVLRDENPIVTNVGGGMSTSLSIYLQIPGSVPRLELYSSVQVSTHAVEQSVVQDDETLAPLMALKSADLQSVVFPRASDSDWTLSTPLNDLLIKSLGSTENVTITAQWTFARALSPFMTTLSSSVFVKSADILAAIQSPHGGELRVPNLIPRAAYLDSTPVAKIITDEGMKQDTKLELDVMDSSGNRWWNLAGPQDILCVGERSMNSGGSSISSMSVVGLYLGVVLTIGRFLRLSLQGSSKRIDKEELPSTETLMQVCQGIQIARLFKDTNAENRLYYDLVRLFRDPQLLISATGTTVPSNH